jgi:hypothetical protein
MRFPPYSSLQHAAARLLAVACLLSPALSLVYNSTALIVASDAEDLDSAAYLLTGYGIAHEELQVPEGGTDLPTLESGNGGNYGLFVLVSQVKYDGDSDSSLTTDQWNSLYDYQIKYGVRMVQMAVAPSSTFGVTQVGSCCNDNEEQNITLISSVQSSEFPTAGLK